MAPLEGTEFSVRALPRAGASRIAKPVVLSGAAIAAALIGVALIVVALIVVAGLLVSRGGDSAPQSSSSAINSGELIIPDPADIEDSNAQRPEADVASPAAQPPDIRQIDDDGKTLWASPTTGEPVVIRYLPSGIQAYLAVRTADLLTSDEGARVFEALGPSGLEARALLRFILGVELAEIEVLEIALYSDDAGSPQTAFVMRAREPFDSARLLAAWKAPVPATHQSRAYFQNSRWGYWLPESEAGRVVAIVPRAAITEVLELDGRPLMPKGFERLLRRSDANRHFNLLVVPGYFSTDGASLLSGRFESLRTPLLHFFDGGTEAALLSGHLGERFFLELRVPVPADRRATDVAAGLKTRLAGVAAQLDSSPAARGKARRSTGAFGQSVIDRFPLMVKTASDLTRSGVDDRQAVLTCYLPLPAAHNLMMGAELTLFGRPASQGQLDAGDKAHRPTSTRLCNSACL